MDYQIISSGSKGNAVLLDGGVLVDCGVSWKKLTPIVPDIRLVLLTHCHGDHFNESTVKRLAQERPTVRFGCCLWMLPYLAQAKVSSRNIDLYKPKQMFRYSADLKVMPYELVHDVQNCGYLITFKGERAFYATDTWIIPDNVEADLYLIEGNHHEAEIAERIREKRERGEFSYEVRAAKTHMSIEKAEYYIRLNAPPCAKYVLMHQHQD